MSTRAGDDSTKGVLGASTIRGALAVAASSACLQLDGSRRVRQSTTIVEKPMSLPPMVTKT